MRRVVAWSFPKLLDLYVYDSKYGGAFYDVNELPYHLEFDPPDDSGSNAAASSGRVRYELYNAWLYSGNHFNGYFLFAGEQADEPSSVEPFWVFNDCISRPTTQLPRRDERGIIPPRGYEVMSVWYRRVSH